MDIVPPFTKSSVYFLVSFVRLKHVFHNIKTDYDIKNFIKKRLVFQVFVSEVFDKNTEVRHQEKNMMQYIVVHLNEVFLIFRGRPAMTHEFALFSSLGRPHREPEPTRVHALNLNNGNKPSDHDTSFQRT